VDDGLLCRMNSILHTRQSAIQLYRITSTKCSINTVVPPDDGPGEVRNMQRCTKYTKNKLCTKLVLFTRLNLDLGL